MPAAVNGRLSDGLLILLDTGGGRKLHVNGGWGHSQCGRYLPTAKTLFEDEVDADQICSRCLQIVAYPDHQDKEDKPC